MTSKNFSKFDGSFLSKLKLALEIIWVFTKSLPIFASTFYRKWFPGEGKDLTNKIVLITGAGNGLGKELSFQFARLGSKVICVDIKKKDNEETVRQIKEETGDSRAKSFICDISDQEAVDLLKEKVLKEYEHVDILVNNAGIIYGNNIFTGDVSNIKRVVDVNLMSSYWMTRAFIPCMRDRREGHVVFINSMASLTPMGGGIVYCVTKFGLLGLTNALMEDFRKDPTCANIKISSAHPYFINTGNWYSEKLFNIRIKPLKTNTAARLIITGIRREYVHFTIPGFETGFWLASWLRLLPIKTFHMFRDVIYSDLATFENDKAYRNIPGKDVGTQKHFTFAGPTWSLVEFSVESWVKQIVTMGAHILHESLPLGLKVSDGDRISLIEIFTCSRIQLFSQKVMAKEELKLNYVPGNFSILMGFTRILQFFWFMTLSIPDLLLALVRKFFPKRGKNISGKIVLITGAANGLGRALAFEFAKKGSKIICVDINEPANTKTVQEINKIYGNTSAAKSFTCDVGDPKAIKKLAEDVLHEYGHVDILVSNAGVIYGKTILNEEEAMVQKVLDVNQMSSYWMVRNFLPNMKERNDGHLVFINSIASLTPLGDAAMYTITKYALLGLTAALADEFSRDPSYSNIKISSVHPFFMATEGLKAQPLSNRLLVMRVEEAAQMIVCGIRREYFNFTVPGFETGFWFLSLARIIPLKVYNKLAQQVHKQIVLPEKK